MTHDESHGEAKDAAPPEPLDHRPVVWGIVVVALLWIGLTLAGKTTYTEEKLAPHKPEEHAPAATDGHGPKVAPAIWAVTPFVLLLGAIAIFPLWSVTEHWWESNTSKLILAGGLAIVTLLYYATLYEKAGVESVGHVLQHAILQDYIPFIILLFSLYTISGGIRIEGDLVAHPGTNAAFMAIGAVLASFIGTTGAAMLLIRPLIETNNERKHIAHTVVFFIFTVCNCGGCLLPLGDPPLFLGYLKGVDFLWTAKMLWLPWLITNALIIAVYYVWDFVFVYPTEDKYDVARDTAETKPMRIRGLEVNGILLLLVVLAVAFLDPSKAVPGTNYHPHIYLREIVLLGLVAASLALGSREVREDNGFNYGAIIEVAALFIGIFITMAPAIEYLRVNGGALPLSHPIAYFWASGSLSAVLDNAPTYLVFYEAAEVHLHGGNLYELVNQPTPAGRDGNLHLMAVSLGAVFMGAMTYIGNGPNFMVRSIAEQSGVKMPSFFGYCLFYSFPVLLPILALVSYLFLIILA